MTTTDLLAELWREGTPIRLTEDGVNLAVPAGRLSSAQRERILAHKQELVAFLHAAHETAEQLLAAAMRCCDHHHDGAQARQEMRDQCWELPLHLRPNLLKHLNTTYPPQVK